MLLRAITVSRLYHTLSCEGSRRSPYFDILARQDTHLGWYAVMNSPDPPWSLETAISTPPSERKHDSQTDSLRGGHHPCTLDTMDHTPVRLGMEWTPGDVRGRGALQLWISKLRFESLRPSP